MSLDEVLDRRRQVMVVESAPKCRGSEIPGNSDG
jgi:hypothetical protein